MGISVAQQEEHGSVEDVRKRALLALEGGRSVVSGFSRVEIPDWKTPTAENKVFDWDPCKFHFHYYIRQQKLFHQLLFLFPGRFALIFWEMTGIELCH